MVVGCWLLVDGCWLLLLVVVAGWWLMVVGCWLLVVGFRGELNSPAHDNDKFPNIRLIIPTQESQKTKPFNTK
jgi:hypothetical protein